MVHCVSSSEPDSGGDAPLASEEWRGNVQPTTNPGSVKEAPLGGQTPGQQLQQPQQATTPQPQQQTQQPQPLAQTKTTTFVESSTVTSGIQVGSLEQAACAGATSELTLTETITQLQPNHHQLADTTHLDNTHEPMDTIIPSSPNHSINSDTLVITECISEELSGDGDCLINKDVVRELLPSQPQQQSFSESSSYHIHQQQQQPVLVDSNSEDNCVSNIYEEQQLAAATAIVPEDVQKFYSVGVTAPGLYPHLYNIETDEGMEQQQQQSLAVINYQASEKLQIQQQAYFSPYVYNGDDVNYVEGDAELEEESTESSDEEDEDL